MPNHFHEFFRKLYVGNDLADLFEATFIQDAGLMGYDNDWLLWSVCRETENHTLIKTDIRYQEYCDD